MTAQKYRVVERRDSAWKVKYCFVGGRIVTFSLHLNTQFLLVYMYLEQKEPSRKRNIGLIRGIHWAAKRSGLQRWFLTPKTSVVSLYANSDSGLNLN